MAMRIYSGASSVHSAQDTLRSQSFKIIIPETVEHKIRVWCDLCPDVEYSGTLFYTIDGSIEANDLVVTAEDFFVMDIGNSTYTEFEMNPDVVDYMARNELLDCKMGLIHSHNNMATFFSGTDVDTLDSEGMKMAHFVSLIVNNDGEYSARITRQVKETIYNARKKRTFSSYSGDIDDSSETDINPVTSTTIEYFNLVVEKHPDHVDAVKEECKRRFAEIRSNKAVNTTPAVAGRVSSPPLWGSYRGGYGGFANDDDEYPSYGKQAAYKKEEEEKEEKRQVMIRDEEDDYRTLFDDAGEGIAKVDKNRILDEAERIADGLVPQILFGSIFSSQKVYDKVPDINVWISKTMNAVFYNRFGSSQNYDKFFNNYLDFLIYDIDVEDFDRNANKLLAEEVLFILYNRFNHWMQISFNNFLQVIVDNLRSLMSDSTLERIERHS